MNIGKRVAALEVALAGRHRDDPRQTAMSRLFDDLSQALPDDEVEPGFAIRSVLSPTYRSSLAKIMDLADRITADDLGEEDRLLLEGLPHDALECLDMTAPELVTMLARVRRMY